MCFRGGPAATVNDGRACPPTRERLQEANLTHRRQGLGAEALWKLQEASRRRPRSFKRPLGGFKRHPRGIQEASRGLKRLQEASKRLQEASKRLQEASKRLQEASRGLKRLQEAFKSKSDAQARRIRGIGPFLLQIHCVLQSLFFALQIYCVLQAGTPRRCKAAECLG